MASKRTKYANKQVLVTGFQNKQSFAANKTTGMISVTDIAEIEVFNVTTIPQSSLSPDQSESTQGAN